MEEMEDRKWEDLDMDCLVNVFGRLGLEEMILSVPFVCQSWYKASTNPLCWKVLNFIPLNLSDWDASDFEGRFMREYRLQKYSFTGLLKFVVTRSHGSAVVLKFPAEDVNLDNIIYVSDECLGLKCLALPRLDRRFLPELVGKWKHLEILLLQGMPSCISEMIKVINNHCKNFVGLKASGWVDDNVASAIVMFLPKIKYLVLSASTLSKENLMVILEGCKDLELLYLKNCVGFDVDEEILKRASHIRDFNCEGAQLEEDYDDHDYQLSSRDVDCANSDGGYDSCD
ncbi:F-box/LRR-repeat protein At3g48880-like [Tasmannia lanceolata]|uniref:F-box/LRR-repeat protein At3g48880-like n=1 Tax=Tasmannia lanceolata TaxID=3420 RepID=UPI0040643FA1